MKIKKSINVFTLVSLLTISMNTFASGMVICIIVNNPSEVIKNHSFNLINSAFAESNSSVSYQNMREYEGNAIKSVASFFNAIASIESVDLKNITDEKQIEKINKAAFYFMESNKYISSIKIKNDPLMKLTKYNSIFIESINKKKSLPNPKIVQKATLLVLSMVTQGVYRSEAHRDMNTPNHPKSAISFKK